MADLDQHGMVPEDGIPSGFPLPGRNPRVGAHSSGQPRAGGRNPEEMLRSADAAFPPLRLRGFLGAGRSISALRTGLAAFALIVFFWPVWEWYFVRMTDGSDEPLGLLALVAALWLGWEGRKEAGLRVGVGFAACLAAYLVLMVAGGALLLRGACAVGAIGMLVVGNRRGAAGILGLLLLSLPVMASVQFYLGYPMRIFAGWVSEAGLGIFGIETAREGTTLFWRGVPVVVDAPCSGARMLWCALALHCFLVARRGCGAGAVMLGGFCVVLVVLHGNALRSTVLFLNESGMAPMPEWMHEGIGLFVFALVCLAVVRFHSAVLNFRFPAGRWMGAACLAAALPLALLLPERSMAGGEGFPGWPDRFEGRLLTEVALDAVDARFAEDFPGRIARFTDGERWLIVRWVGQATRKLHSTADCLRGMGYTIGERTIRRAVDETRWAVFPAWNRHGEAMEVRERIVDGRGRGWTDVSEWYWNAVGGKTEGPWWAVTVLE